jgi:hypothetical protein
MNAILNQIAPETVGVLVQQAAAHGLSPNEYLQQLLRLHNGHQDDLSLAADPTPVTTEESLAAFRQDLEALAEDTEHLPAAPITYSRAEIYFDHD